jgi:hypothetical protein
VREAEELTPENVDLMLTDVLQKATAAAERVPLKYRDIAFAAIETEREAAIQKAESLARGARDIRHFGFDHEMICERHLDQLAGEFGSYPLAQGLARWSWAVETAAPETNGW